MDFLVPSPGARDPQSEVRVSFSPISASALSVQWLNFVRAVTPGCARVLCPPRRAFYPQHIPLPLGVRRRPSWRHQQEIQTPLPGRRVLAAETPRRLQLPSEQHGAPNWMAIFIQTAPESAAICLGVRHAPSHTHLPSRANHVVLSPATTPTGASGIPRWTVKASSQAPPACASRASALFR